MSAAAAGDDPSVADVPTQPTPVERRLRCRDAEAVPESAQEHRDVGALGAVVGVELVEHEIS